MKANEFWEENDTRKDQKFYVAFCLLETALGDYATARDLHEHKKLNWAATAYYYSLVHAMGLITFIAVGDFPTGHSQLAVLYKNGTNGGGYTWLPKFLRDSGNRTQIEPTIFTRDAIGKYFNNDEPELSETNDILQKWGEVPDKSRECRNDTNYEGLIVAHEHAHQLVTESIGNLAETLRKVCDTILPEVVLLLRKYINENTRRDYWYSHLNWRNKREGLYYFKQSLKFRIKKKIIIDSILKWVEPLKKDRTNVNQAKEVFDNIKLGVFNTKESLMESF